MAEAMSNLVGFNGDVVSVPPRSPRSLCRCNGRRDAIELRFSGSGDGESIMLLDVTSLLLFAGAIRTPPWEIPRVPCIAWEGVGVGSHGRSAASLMSKVCYSIQGGASFGSSYDVVVPDYDHSFYLHLYDTWTPIVKVSLGREGSRAISYSLKAYGTSSWSTGRRWRLPVSLSKRPPTAFTHRPSSTRRIVWSS